MNEPDRARAAAARRDGDTLLNAALRLARHHLTRAGEFYPFGYALDASKDPWAFMADPRKEFPESMEVLDLLYEAARGIDGLRAVAFVSDSRLTRGPHTGDAVRVDLEHPDDDPVTVYAPYELERLRGGGSFGELVATAGAARVWQRDD